MNFQYIVKVEKASQIADIAFSTAKKSGEMAWQNLKKKDKVSRRRTAEKERLNAVRRIISRRLNKIHDQFPVVKDLPLFYQKLFKNNIDFDKYRQSMQAIKWTSEKIEELYNGIHKKIRNSYDPGEMSTLRNQFYARTDSLLKKLQKSLDFLEESRKKLRRFPDLKPDMYTIAIAGFPNVGKSSLLKALTTSNPEISNYAFTTKGLNTGYMKADDEYIQIIDVPGTLDRENKNIIEKNAILVLENVTNEVIFLIDPSETSGYTIEEQIKLMDKFSNEFEFKPLCILNKIDITSNEKIKFVQQSVENPIKISTIKNKGITELQNKIRNMKKEKK
ncbi:MAG: NOG1 family protein [Candidatus Nanoarchaeia archaeon]